MRYGVVSLPLPSPSCLWKAEKRLRPAHIPPLFTLPPRRYPFSRCGATYPASKAFQTLSSETACSWKEIRLELFINMIEKAKRQTEEGEEARREIIGNGKLRVDRDRDRWSWKGKERGNKKGGKQRYRETGGWGREGWIPWAEWVMRWQRGYIQFILFITFMIKSCLVSFPSFQLPEAMCLQRGYLFICHTHSSLSLRPK